MDHIRQQIIQLLMQSKNILIMPSAPADGDSLGSALALYLALKKLQKEVTVVSTEPVPDAFQFLPTTNVIHHEFSAGNDFIVTLDCEQAKIDTIKTKLENNKVNIIITAKKGQFSEQDVSFEHGPSKYDVIITVDTGDLSQLGRFYEDNTELFTRIPVINIDHHASNDHFGKINLVDIMASATTELLIPLVEDLERFTDKKLMDEDIATLLLAGIITDTGSFQNANTTPRSFASAARLVKYGARQQEIIRHVFKTKNLSTLRLWGRILSNIKVDASARFVWATISRKDFEDTASREDETGGIIDELMTNAPGTEIAVLLKDRGNGVISGSVRTTNAGIDASKIAAMFGGGGHVQAAGFKVDKSNLEEMERLVTEKIKAFQRERLGIIKAEEEPGQVSALPVKEIFTSPLPSTMAEKIALPDEERSSQLSTANMIASEAQPEVQQQTADEASASIEVEKMVPFTSNQAATDISFTDVIVRQAVPQQGQTIELQPNMTYKFEE